MADSSTSGVTSAASASLQNLAYQLMAADRAPLERLQQQKTNEQQKVTAYQSLGSKLSTLLRMAQDFSLPGSIHPLRQLAVSVPDTSSLDVTVRSGADTGSHAIEVQQLATRYTAASSTVLGAEKVSGDAVSAASRFRVTVGGQAYEFTASVDPGATWEDALSVLARAINDGGAPISASVLRSSDGERRLILQSDDSGVAAKITSVEDLEGSWMSQLGLAGSAADSTDLAATVQSAQDARLVVDGMSVTSSSNTVEDLLPGMTVVLKGPSDGSQNVRISRDVDAVVTKVKAFIDAYNAALDEVRKDTQAADSDGNNRGLLAGDTMFVRLRSNMYRATSGAVAGLSGDWTKLTDLGVTIAQDGKLSLSNETSLRDAVGSSPDAVEAIFRDGVASRLADLLDDYSKTGGLLYRQTDAAQKRIRSIDDRVERTNKTLATRQEALIKQLAELQASVTTLSNQSSYLQGLLSSGDQVFA